MTDSDDLPPPRRDQLSKTPSWIMVGFVIGCLFAYGVQDRVAARNEERRAAEAARATPAAPTPSPTPVPPQERPALIEVEAVFAQNLDRVVWEHDLTEVAMWNVHARAYTEFFEIMRSGGAYYFRSIPRLTRPIIDPEAAHDALLRFTETTEMREKRLEKIPPFFRPAPPKP